MKSECEIWKWPDVDLGLMCKEERGFHQPDLIHQWEVRVNIDNYEGRLGTATAPSDHLVGLDHETNNFQVWPPGILDIIPKQGLQRQLKSRGYPARL